MKFALGDINNRETSIAIWSVIIVLFLLRDKGIRVQCISLIRTFFDKKLVAIYAVAIIYVLIVVYSMAIVGVWQSRDTKTTILWFLGPAMASLLNINKAQNGEYFLQKIKNIFKWTLLVEFISEMESFSLPLELLLVPVLFIVAMMQALPKREDRYKDAEKVLSYIYNCICILMFSLYLYKAIKDYKEVFAFEHLTSFIIPIILTIVFIPLLYSLAIVYSYETLFKQIDFFNKDRNYRRKFKRCLIKMARFDLYKLNRVRPYIIRLVEPSNYDLERRMKKVIRG